MKKMLAAILLILTLGATKASALDMNTRESECWWNTGQKICTGVTSCVYDVAGLGAMTSVSTLNVVGFSFSILPVGSSATVTISQLVHTTPSGSSTLNFNNSYPSTWSVGIATMTSGSIFIGPAMSNKDWYQGNFEAVTTNPYFSLTGLTTAGTTYINVEYCTKKYQY